MRFHLSLVSGNKKTGPIPVSTTEKDSCPDVCPLKTIGCYAKSGPLNLHWTKLSNGIYKGLSLKEFVAKIKSFHIGQLWRHNQAGDLPGINNKIDSAALKEIVSANRGRKGFTYTHKPVLQGQTDLETVVENQAAILHANQNGFTVNLSANSVSHADKLMALGIAPVITIVHSEQKKNFLTPGGNRVLICPATTHDNVSCSRCGLCQRSKRDYIIGFPAHSISYKRVNQIVTNNTI